MTRRLGRCCSVFRANTHGADEIRVVDLCTSMQHLDRVANETYDD